MTPVSTNIIELRTRKNNALYARSMFHVSDIRVALDVSGPASQVSMLGRNRYLKGSDILFFTVAAVKFRLGCTRDDKKFVSVVRIFQIVDLYLCE